MSIKHSFDKWKSVSHLISRVGQSDSQSKWFAGISSNIIGKGVGTTHDTYPLHIWLLRNRCAQIEWVGKLIFLRHSIRSKANFSIFSTRPVFLLLLQRVLGNHLKITKYYGPFFFLSPKLLLKPNIVLVKSVFASQEDLFNAGEGRTLAFAAFV